MVLDGKSVNKIMNNINNTKVTVMFSSTNSVNVSLIIKEQTNA